MLYYKTNTMVFFYSLTLALLAIYSYSQLDLNITLSKFQFWSQFRNVMVQLGYYHRFESTIIFASLMILLFVFHLLFMRHYKRHSAFRIALITTTILICSYPFLSHDFFNYMFDAKIFTYYQQNPYLHKALDFPDAPELRFMHWTHRTYPYGPTFLPITLIPSFLGFGKFLVAYGMFKVMFASFYLLGVWSLRRINEQWAMFFATQPLVLIEGLMNNHNDLIAVSLGLMSIQLIWSKKELPGRVFAILSGGIKYVTLPLLLVQKNPKSPYTRFAFGLVVILLLYLSFSQEPQPWYFLSLLAFIPYMFELIKQLQIFFFGLVLSYYPFVLYGTWGETQNVVFKHRTMILFAMINLVVLVVQRKKLRPLW